MHTVDELDIKILNLLQENAKISRSQIAEIVSMSVPSVSERLHKLEEKGIIKGYFTRLNRKYFNYDIMAFIVIISDSSKYYDKLISNCDKHPNILECHAILGEGSHVLKAIVKNTEALEKLLMEIQSWPGVLSTRSSLVLSTTKETEKILL